MVHNGPNPNGSPTSIPGLAFIREKPDQRHDPPRTVAAAAEPHQDVLRLTIAGQDHSDPQGRPDVVPDAEVYAGAFGFSPTGIAVFDLEGTIRHANPALATLVGQPVDAIVGSPMVDFVQPQYRSALAAWVASVGLGTDVPPPIRGEAWHVRPDGARVYGVVEVAFVTDADGHPRYGLAAAHDQTHIKALEEAASASQAELAVLVETVPIPIYKLDRDHVIRVWNPAAEALYGWTETGALNRPITALPGVDSDHVAQDTDLLFASPPLRGYETVRAVRDGTECHLSVWTTPIYDNDENVTSLIVAAVDVTEPRRAAKALEASAHRFQSLIRNISDTVTVIGVDGTIEFSTGEDDLVLGYSASWWEGRNVYDLAHPDEVEWGTKLIRDLIDQPGAELTAELRARHADGHWEHLHLTGRNLLDDPDVRGLVLTTRNITEQALSDQLLSAQAQILELIATSSELDQTINAVLDMVTTRNDGTWATFHLLDHDQLVPRGTRHLSHDVLGTAARAVPASATAGPVGLALNGGVEVVITDITEDERVADRRGELIDAGIRSVWSMPVLSRSEARPLGVLTVYRDTSAPPDPHRRRTAALAGQLIAIAVERQEGESRLAHQALHDDLTGLPNRTLLLDRLNHALTRAHHLGEEVAVLFLDLDRFKVVNDSLGHGAGDQLLVRFAERLGSIVRPDDTVARFGGDEFVIVCEQRHRATVTVAIAERLDQVMREPFVLDDGVEVFLTVSLGLAVGEDADGEILLRNADAAMYRAKELGRNRLEVFDEAMQTEATTRLTVGNDLRRAVERQEFVVLHQPIVDLASGDIIGSEALVRWDHPTRGLLLPKMFIPITEESGLIVAVGEWVLHTALAHARAWTDLHGLAGFSQSVNLSARQLGSPGLVASVAEALDRHHWPASDLCLELTESVLLDDLDVTLPALSGLKDLGVRLAIDDFGTGYSSLTYLQQFPVDSLKIDQTFVARLGVEPSGSGEEKTIPRAVVVMAHAMGLEALAEGVETEAQLQVLCELGCDQAQGYLFSPAVTYEAFSDLLTRQAATDRTTD